MTALICFFPLCTSDGTDTFFPICTSACTVSYIPYVTVPALLVLNQYLLVPALLRLYQYVPVHALLAEEGVMDCLFVFPLLYVQYSTLYSAVLTFNIL